MEVESILKVSIWVPTIMELDPWSQPATRQRCHTRDLASVSALVERALSTVGRRFGFVEYKCVLLRTIFKFIKL